ncbi:MAG: hypothetical protein KDB37_17130 [Ilumatobacter sp.]|nr:hypothetical protein [Ilumatobacter sp.]
MVAVVGAGVVVAVSSTTDTSVVDTTVLDGGRASLLLVGVGFSLDSSSLHADTTSRQAVARRAT